MTIVLDSITSRQIRIRVKMTNNNALLTNLDCMATLQEKDSRQINVRKRRYMEFFLLKELIKLVSSYG